MKFLQYTLVVAVLAILLALFLPWWSVAIAGFAGPWIVKRGFGASFAGGFLAVFLLWTGMALWISFSTASPLPDRVALLISPSLSGIGLALVSGAIGGLVAGTGSIAARILRG